jgi:hypothetical protein
LVVAGEPGQPILLALSRAVVRGSDLRASTGSVCSHLEQ